MQSSFYVTSNKKKNANLIRNSRDSTLVHEEQVHPLYVLPPSPPLLYHWLAVQGSVQPHFTSKIWRHCKRIRLLAINYYFYLI